VRGPMKREDHYRIQAEVARLKAGIPCARCGVIEEDAKRMHWHHRNPAEKVACVSHLKSVADARAEIAKCELLCLRCHARHHGLQRGARASLVPVAS
jgi:hypothetical protein